MNDQANVNDGATGAFAPAGNLVTGIGGRRVLWPVAIGAISVAIGAERALSPIGFILQMISDVLEGGGSPLSRFGGNSLWVLVYWSSQMLMGVLSGALLLPAGLLLWRQSRAGTILHVVYAILMIPLNFLWSIAQIMIFPGMARSPLLVWLIWYATMMIIYPVFLLIWFSRPKVKAETRLWR